MVIGDLSGGIRGRRLFLIYCVMSATSSPVALRRASLVSECVMHLLEELSNPLLRPPQYSGPPRPLREAKPGAGMAYPGSGAAEPGIQVGPTPAGGLCEP